MKRKIPVHGFTRERRDSYIDRLIRADGEILPWPTPAADFGNSWAGHYSFRIWLSPTIGDSAEGTSLIRDS